MRNVAGKRQDTSLQSATSNGAKRPARRSGSPLKAQPSKPAEPAPAEDGQVVFEPDAALVAAAEAALGPMPDRRRGHYVIDPGDLRAAIGDTFDPTEAEPVSAEEATRLQRLRRLAADPDSLFKAHLRADAALIGRLEAVWQLAPNAAEAIDVVIGAAKLSAMTGAPVDLPPILLVGPAGCGKSRVVRELGRALDTSVLTILGSALADATPILGSGVGWRGAGPARLTEVLLAARTSAPLVFIDEIDKVRLWDRRDHAADILLGLLDRDMAATHQDLYDRVLMRAERVLWILAANTVETLSAPLLDRCLVIDIQPPGRAERREIIQRIHVETRGRLGLELGAALGEDAIAALDEISLRRVGPALQVALGRAVSDGRDRLAARDIVAARAIVERGQPPKRQRIGF